MKKALENEYLLEDIRSHPVSHFKELFTTVYPGAATA
jgi:hypothetical protein